MPRDADALASPGADPAVGAEAEHVRDVAQAVGDAVKREADVRAEESSNIVVRVIDHGIEAAAAALILGIAFLLFVNATGRYLLSQPILWAEEVATSMVIWVAMLGLYVALRRRELLTVRVLVQRLSPELQARWQVVVNLLGAVAFGYLAWLGADYVLSFGSDRTPFLRWPKAVFTSAIPIGAAVVALGLLAEGWRFARGRGQLPVEEEEDVSPPDGRSRREGEEGR
ncbi:MAG: TRAP transporter small permease [Candidatus Limnocylindria bacterium]